MTTRGFYYLYQYCRGGNWGTERSNNLPEVTQWGRGATRLWIPQGWSWYFIQLCIPSTPNPVVFTCIICKTEFVEKNQAELNNMRKVEKIAWGYREDICKIFCEQKGLLILISILSLYIHWTAFFLDVQHFRSPRKPPFSLDLILSWVMGIKQCVLLLYSLVALNPWLFGCLH